MPAQPGLEIVVHGSPRRDRPTLVLLHEGLGSVSLWRDFPVRLAQRCGLAAVVYSRRGYGRSPAFDAPLEPDFMHRAAFEELPAVLDRLSLEQVILVGHSDGGSIALLHASTRPPGLLGVAVMAPHLFVEPVCTASIEALARSWSPESRLARSLARHHSDSGRTFGFWTEAWLDRRFAAWNIEAEVARIGCPVLAIQGHDDQYGTMLQIERIRERVPHAQLTRLADCGHSPHLSRPETVISRITAFVAGLRNPVALS